MHENNHLDQEYWEQRYLQNQTGWDVGAITPPLKTYIDGLKNKEAHILIPGGGNGYEAEYLHQNGFQQVYLLDIAPAPLKHFQERVPDFPEEHLLHQDFFTLAPDQFDLVLEQTFFCALPKSFRAAYARHMFEVLKPQGKLVGLLFTVEFQNPGPPFGGSAFEYQSYFEPYFQFKHFAPAYNSVKPRQGSELFMVLERRDRPQFIA